MNVYVGPVVKINLAERPYQETYNSCPNKDCEYDKLTHTTSQKFCGLCGAKIEPVTFDRVGTRGWIQFVETDDYKWEDVLYSPEYLGDENTEILLSNYSKHGHRVDEDGGFHSINEEEKLKELFEFLEDHRELIDDLKKFFGKDVSFDYGVSAYWS